MTCTHRKSLASGTLVSYSDDNTSLKNIASAANAPKASSTFMRTFLSRLLK